MRRVVSFFFSFLICHAIFLLLKILIPSFLDPSPLFPPAKFRPGHDDAQKAGEAVCNGHGVKGAVQSVGGGERECQGNQEDALTHQRNRQGAEGLSDTLKEGGCGHVDAVEEEGHHVEPKEVGRAIPVKGIVGDKERGDLPRKQQVDCAPASGDDQGDGRGHAVGMVYPPVVFRPEIVAVDGLNGRGDADEHGVGNLVNFHHHAVNGEGHVAAVDRGGAVDAHKIVEHNLHQCGQYLCQKTWEAQLYYPKGQGSRRAQGIPCEAHGLEPAQVEKAQASCDDFADDRGDPRTDDAHMQAEDKNRIEDDIDGGAGHHAFHRVFRRTVGPNHGSKGGADELKGKADGDGPEVGEGFVVGRVRGAEKSHDPRREQGADDGHDEAAHDDPGDTVAEDAIRRILIFSPQAQADVGGAAVAEHKGDGVDEDGDGKGHVYRRHAGDSRTPAHKDLIDDIIKVIDHKGQGRRHRVADKELRDRLRRQRAVDGLRLFHHAPSFFAFHSREVCRK